MTQEKVKNFFNWFQLSPCCWLQKVKSLPATQRESWQREVAIMAVLAVGLMKLKSIPMTTKKHVPTCAYKKLIVIIITIIVAAAYE